MKLTSLLAIFSMLFLSVPAARAETADTYADSAYASLYTYSPSNAAGAADGAYADFLDDDAYVTLDMGEEEGGTGTLTFTSLALEYGGSWQVEFYDDEWNELQSTDGTFDLYQTSTTVPYTLEEPYRYVKVICLNSKLWKLDAVEAASIEEAQADSAAEETTITEDAAEPSEETEAAPPQGLLVKLVDDGDPSTTVDSAVYVIGEDGKRHAFPSATVYETWFDGYADVAFIDPENLAAYELGANVTMRPGTWLVKITTDPKVYAVEPGGVLRWVTTEEIAESLWGSNWNEQIVDVPDTFWSNYTVGDAITVEKHPEGTLAVLSTGEVTYLASDAYYSIAGDTMASLRLDADFEVQLSDEKLEAYAYGGLLAVDPDIAFPY